MHRGEPVRLGSVAWCQAETEAAPVAAAWPDASLIALSTPGRVVVFAVRQGLRSDAIAVVADLALRHEVEILSGDREPAVALVARELGVTRFEAGLKPADKIARLKALASAGRRTLMVGDGLNDAPALAAAHVSISPISAAHIAQAQADAIFLGERLAPVADALRLAAQSAPADAREPLAVRRLQFDRRAAGDLRLRDAADRGARHVGFLDPGDTERAEGAGRAEGARR